ncbi:NAD(P)-binding domain-containing protein, partial [Campylobacter coli]
KIKINEQNAKVNALENELETIAHAIPNIPDECVPVGEDEEENGVFLVSTGKGVYECKNIIVAIGRMGKPNKPDYKLPITLTK